MCVSCCNGFNNSNYETCVLGSEGCVDFGATYGCSWDEPSKICYESNM
jgi:hypothetical protein